MSTPSLGDAVMSLTGYQIADEKIRLACSRRVYPETVDDIDTVTSGSMSPDLGHMWRQGCPQSPELEGELELGSVDEDEEGDNSGSADEKENEGLEDFLKQVKVHCGFWFVSSSHQPMSLKCARQDSGGIQQDCSVPLPFFLMKKAEKDESEPLPEWPSLTFDYKPIFGFDLGVFRPVSSPAAVDTNSREWS